MPISVHGIGMTLGISCNISYSLEQYKYGFAVAISMHYLIQTLLIRFYEAIHKPVVFLSIPKS